MKALTDIDIIDYLECPALWNAKRKGKHNPSIEKLDDDFFMKYIYDLDDFPQWQMDNAKKIFYSRGEHRREFRVAQSAADRLMIDGYISELFTGIESIEIDTTVHGIPVKFSLPGVNIEKQEFTLAVLGLRNLSQKKPYMGESGDMQWVNWIIADEYPARMLFYSEALKNQFCLHCRPFLAVVERCCLPDYELYDCSEIIELEREKLEFLMQELESVIAGDFQEDSLAKCGICEYCRNQKQIIEPQKLTFS